MGNFSCRWFLRQFRSSSVTFFNEIVAANELDARHLYLLVFRSLVLVRSLPFSEIFIYLFIYNFDHTCSLSVVRLFAHTREILVFEPELNTWLSFGPSQFRLEHQNLTRMCK